LPNPRRLNKILNVGGSAQGSGSSGSFRQGAFAIFAFRISGKTLLALAFGFLLCSVVAREYPELLSLTDCTSNDYTLLRASSDVKASAASNDELDHLKVVCAASRLEMSELSQFASLSGSPSDSPPPKVLLPFLCTLRT
jgi:hypothetical protein